MTGPVPFPDGPQPIDSKLVEYSDRIAGLFQREDKVGLLATRIETQPQQYYGRLWWKVRIDEKKALGFEVVWLDSANSHGYYGAVDPHDETIADFDAGVFRLAGDIYELKWLSGDELEAASRYLSSHFERQDGRE